MTQPSLASFDRDLLIPGVVRTLRVVARSASVLAIVVGALVLLGWWSGIELLKRVVPGLVAMNPATAVGIICLGGSLALLAGTPSVSRRRAGHSLALVAGSIGAARLIALLTGYDAGIDQILFAAQLETADGGAPNRMAPNTALNFLLLGGALLSMDRRFWRLHNPAQLLAAIAGMSALLALLGYAYGVRSFYGIGSYIPMAVHTAAMFGAVATGVLCARPTQGIMAVLSSRTSGGTTIRRMLPVFFIVPAVLAALRVGGGYTFLDPAFGSWLVVVVIMTVFAVLIGWNARLLFRADVDRAAAEHTLAHQAMHDSLTQLPNRRLFTQRVAEALENATSSHGVTAILFLDLDLFKVINDSLGHVVGDDLLIAAGERIQTCLGEGDLAARLSGDEFTVLMPEVESRARAEAMAGCILRAFGEQFTVGPHKVFTTVSIGIAFSEPNDTAVNLVRHADIAMYHAKARGKARYEVFDPSMDLVAIRRLELELELRRALDEGQLRVFYQPEVEIESGRLVGMEALVRWAHPTRGLIPPSEFLAVAEETGLILQIGRFVMMEACRQAHAWQEKYRSGESLLVSVNLSGRHFQQATLIDEVADVLEKTGLDPSHLIIEITETVAMAGAETTIEVMTRLKALGVLLAIDDFGTGFSSLAYLKRFPVDLLKIDKSFIDGVALPGHDSAIIQAIITLGHALDLSIIAEGVETVEQFDELRALGLEFGQGYFFGRPLSDDVKKGMPALIEQMDAMPRTD